MCTIAHVHGGIYQECGFFSTINKQEILDLLAILWLPTKLAIIHHLVHQRADTPTARGNQRANWMAKEATEQMTVLALMLPDPGPPNLLEDPAYTPANLCMIQSLLRSW